MVSRSGLREGVELCPESLREFVTEREKTAAARISTLPRHLFKYDYEMGKSEAHLSQLMETALQPVQAARLRCLRSPGAANACQELAVQSGDPIQQRVL